MKVVRLKDFREVCWYRRKMEKRSKRIVLVMLRYAMKGLTKKRKKRKKKDVWCLYTPGKVAQQPWPKPLESHVEYDVPIPSE